MFTEDDDKVVVNNDKNSDYANFYTSFINNEKTDKKKKSTKKESKKKQENSKPKEDYSDFYSSFMKDEKEKQEEQNDAKARKIKSEKESITKDLQEQEEQEEYKDEDDYSDVYQFYDNGNKKNVVKIIAFALGLIIVVALLIFLAKTLGLFGKKEDIILTNDKISINSGETSVISYQIVNTEENVGISFSSSNPNVAIVDSNGKVTGISSGETEIIISYTIGSKTREKKCKIIVLGEGNVNKNITLNVKFDKGSNNKWINKDVVLFVNASSIYNIVSLQYAIDCEDNKCNYNDIQDNKIKVTNPGITNVTIVARDETNQEKKEQYTIKIDKEAPNVTFNEKSTITSNKDINVCATCNDSLSGCKREKVCVKYTSSKSNQRIVVEDNAGNKTYSPSFNVKINKPVSATCSLSVSNDGTVTATVPNGAKYYGFSSSYSGSNTKSKKFDISVANGGTKAKLIYYYFIDSNGNKRSCSRTIIKDCSNGTCIFRAG